MTEDIGIVVLHGIGRHSGDCFRELEEGLNRELDRLGVPPRRIAGFRYSDIGQSSQDRYWRSLDSESISLERFRELLLNYLGDAGAYGTRPRDRTGNYRKIHSRLETFLVEELSRISSRGKLIVLAQSFGAHIFSNFVWDYRKRMMKPRKPNGFLGRLRLLITTGCNIPIIIAGLDKPRPIPRPNPLFRWVNIYDRDDVLGWPLKPLGGEYAAAGFITDRVVDSGLPLMSHLSYWKNRRPLSMIAGEIADSVQAGQIIQLPVSLPSA